MTQREASNTLRRVYFDEATQTIRQCPEGYTLAERLGNQWFPLVDNESPVDEGTVAAAIDDYEEDDTGDGNDLALFLEHRLWDCTED